MFSAPSRILPPDKFSTHGFQLKFRRKRTAAFTETNLHAIFYCHRENLHARRVSLEMERAQGAVRREVVMIGAFSQVFSLPSTGFNINRQVFNRGSCTQRRRDNEVSWLSFFLSSSEQVDAYTKVQLRTKAAFVSVPLFPSLQICNQEHDGKMISNSDS